MTLKQLTRKAIETGIVPGSIDGRTVANKYRRNLREPGDCQGDDALLMGLAIAEAYVRPSGNRMGWIPETQKLGCQIADLCE